MVRTADNDKPQTGRAGSRTRGDEHCRMQQRADSTYDSVSELTTMVDCLLALPTIVALRKLWLSLVIRAQSE